MNIPLIGDVAKQDINTSLIAIRNAINELNNSSNKSNADIQKQINLINKQIKEFNIKFGDIDTHLNTIDSDITDLQPVDTVASGNMKAVTSNAVFNLNSTNVIHNYSNKPRNVFTLLLNCANRRISFIQIGGSNISNSPNDADSNVFNYVVFKTENYITVTAYDLNSNNVYQNSCQNGTWRSWEKVWLEQTIPMTEITDTTGHIHVFYIVKNGICKLRIDCEDQVLTAGSYTITGIPRCPLGTSAGGNILTWGSQIQGYFLVNSDSLTVVPTVSNQAFTGNFVYLIA